jgi:hypothetical protein
VIYVEYAPTAAGVTTAALSLLSTTGLGTVNIHGSAQFLDLIVLFDNSGSMSWKPDGTDTADSALSRLRYAKDAGNILVGLTDGVTGAPQGVRMGVCVFNFAGEPSSHGCPLGADPFVTGPLTTAINSNVSIVWDGTQMGRGLQAAKARFSDSSRRRVILMLSNGAHNTGIAPEGLLGGTGVTLFAVGYGSTGDVDPARLSGLVVESGNTPANGLRHYNPVGGCPSSVPASSCLTTAKQLDAFFAGMLQNLGLLQAAADPTATVAPGQTLTHDVDVTDLDRTAQFLLSWETAPVGFVRFDLLAGDGAVVDPVVARTDRDVEFVTGPSYRLYRVHDGYLRRPGKIGRWKMRVSLGGSVDIGRAAVVAARPFTYSYAAYMESGLQLNVAFDQLTYTTGRPWPRHRPASGVALSGPALDGIKGRLERPEQGIGTWHAEHAADPQWIAAIPAVRSAEPLSGAQRKGLALRLVGGVAPPFGSPQPDLDFTDDGQNGDAEANDGVYTARFTDTSKPDTYTFHITAKGRTPGGSVFTREALVQQFVPVNVVPDVKLSPLTFQVIKVSGPKVQVLVNVIPKDRFGNFLGPGHADGIAFQTTDGSFVNAIQDDLRGGYSRVLEYAPATQSPDVTVSVDAKPFPTQDVQHATGPRYEIGVFAGRFWFDKQVPVDDGAVFGVRVGRPLSSTLTAEAEFGLTPTNDATGQGGTVYQSFVNLRWSLGALTFRNLTPFVTGGLGVLNFSGFTNTDTSAAVSIGVGFSARVTPRASFRIDLRDIVGLDVYEQKTDNLQATFGFTIGF